MLDVSYDAANLAGNAIFSSIEVTGHFTIRDIVATDTERYPYRVGRVGIMYVQLSQLS